MPFGKLLFDVFEVLDVEAEVVDPARRRVAAVAQDRQREIAVAHVHGAAALGMDELHAEDLLVELGESRRVLGLDREVADLGHAFAPLIVVDLQQRWYEMPRCQSNRRSAFSGRSPRLIADRWSMSRSVGIGTC